MKYVPCIDQLYTPVDIQYVLQSQVNILADYKVKFKKEVKGDKLYICIDNNVYKQKLLYINYCIDQG